MGQNIWDDEVSEYDLLDDQAAEAEALAEQYASQPIVIEATEQELDDVAEHAAFELDHQESNTIYNARIRLEQARLYEMIMNHNMFEGVDADPRAVKVVQDELKFYILKRLEILLGLRQPEAKIEKSSDLFNDVEADYLKQLAYMGTKGASAQGQAVKPRQSSGLKPIGAAKPKAGLKPLQSRPAQAPAAPVQAPAPQPVARAPQQRRRAVKQSASPTGARPAKKKIVQNTAGVKRDLRPDEIEAIARQEIAELSKRKPFDKMTKKEKIAEIKRVNEKHKRVMPNNPVMPQLSPEQELQKYMTQQLIHGSKRGSMGELNDTIARVMISRKEKLESEGE